MISDDDLASLRFGMTAIPLPGGQPGDYEERLTQWFLERSFFRDFTYRNPPKKKGEELADAVILFGDAAFLVQVKAQHGKDEAGRCGAGTDGMRRPSSLDYRFT